MQKIGSKALEVIMDMEQLRTETIGIIGAYDQEEGARYKSFTPPLCQTVTFPLESAETARRIYDHRDPYTDYAYTRRNNPTNDIFEQRMAAMEGGEATLATSSGMAAIYSIASYLLEAGTECVVSNRTYAKTFEVFKHAFTKFGVRVRIVNDPTNHDEWAAKLNKNTRCMYVETPSNPGLVISDISKLAEIGDAHGLPLVVDNTLASPIATRPLELGATVVIESVSKYISGNGSTLGGILVTKKDWIDEIRRTV
jgi:O-acetylhomoserine (thiol)-lyase